MSPIRQVQVLQIFSLESLGLPFAYSVHFLWDFVGCYTLLIESWIIGLRRHILASFINTKISGIAFQIFPSICNNYSLLFNPKTPSKNIFGPPFITLPAQPQSLVSYAFPLSFFLSGKLSSFWQHVIFTYFPTSDFDQTWSKWPVPWPLLVYKQRWGQRSRWGHWGQKFIFIKKASTPTDYVTLTWNSRICISLTPSTKLWS